MITGISIVAVPVDNIDEALHFYCDVLGMEKRRDLSLGDEDRYVEVAPPASPVALLPYTHYDQEPGKATIGEYSRVVRVSDVRSVHRQSTAQGVRFEHDPFDLPRGTLAALRDPWHNLFVLTDGSDF